MTDKHSAHDACEVNELANSISRNSEGKMPLSENPVELDEGCMVAFDGVTPQYNYKGKMS